MSLEPIGIITIICGMICLILGTQATVAVFIVFCSLGSAAAVLIGGANIQPAHLLIIFVATATLTQRRIRHNSLTSFNITEPGFWFLCFVIYGVLSSFFMPRLFSGITNILPLGSSEYPNTGDGLVPLGPVSSNLTQSIYLIGDLICFSVVTAFGSTRRGFRTLETALLAYVAVNICFGILDVATSLTGTQDILQFIRNAQYTFHDQETVEGMRRIIGSWPEASGFASVTLVALAFTGTLFLYGRRPLITGTLTFVSIMFAILSTSSTGLAGIFMILPLLYLLSVKINKSSQANLMSSSIVIFSPLLICTLMLLVFSNDVMLSRIYEYVDTIILSKSASNSGQQRSSWNESAWNNFQDTWGLGVGLGTNRTSNFVLALLSNMGLPGVFLYAIFAAIIFFTNRRNTDSYHKIVIAASRIACLTSILIGIIAGPTVDQGLMFCILAGVACARPEEELCADENRHALA